MHSEVAVLARHVYGVHAFRGVGLVALLAEEGPLADGEILVVGAVDLLLVVPVVVAVGHAELGEFFLGAQVY